MMPSVPSFIPSTPATIRMCRILPCANELAIDSIKQADDSQYACPCTCLHSLGRALADAYACA